MSERPLADLPANQIRQKAGFIGWFICILAAVYYCFAYVLRIYPSVMVGDLRSFFHITATAFGTMTAFYYYAYTPTQLAVGLIIDRFGARLVLTLAAILSTLGVIIFISSHNIYFADFGRFVMGFGAAFAYVTVLKLATVWLPPNRFAMMAGLTTSLGMLAAATSDDVLTKIVQQVGFDRVLDILLAVGSILIVFVFLFVRNRPKDTNVENISDTHIRFSELFSGMGRMFTKPQMWIVGLIGMLLYLPASVFTDTWGIPYLEHVRHLTPDQATSVITMIFIGWIVSSPLLGLLSDRINRRRVPLVACSIMAAIIVMIAFYMPNLSLISLHILFLLFGMCCGVHPLVFAVSRENNPNKMAGTAVAVTNAFIMIGGFLQPIVGMLLDHHWLRDGKLVHGLRAYTAADYSYALTLIPIALVVVAIIGFFIKETYCEMQEG